MNLKTLEKIVNISCFLEGRMTVKIQVIQELIYELKNMKERIANYINNTDYVYSNVFQTWVGRFNKCIDKYNSRLGGTLSHFTIDEWDYSSTQKTIRPAAIESFTGTLKKLIDNFELEVEHLRRSKQEKKVPYYQLRKCFKLNVEGCPAKPSLIGHKVFIGMPFESKYHDSYQYGIKQALDSYGFVHFRADETISNIDIMCKVCQHIQSSRLAIFNISGLNPNVMLELGLAYGIGKPVIIVKDIETKTITDLGSIEYIEYEHAHDLMKKLSKALDDLK